uniref:Uncharacterized protein n=1 Tax=Chaetoceros debilis TaxID=122233 RepID=A0A7S3QJB3_9STRA|mmetsp:Transcript_4184/g.6135  ORF Transcript_4184/g.6135 Transcript_4184/m.6135 type:complete len:113 (+) Transcript_4184:114-452(+)|eukprot:CAMPEP_0194123498 /NCGR_PEP_ID=MMETSP0150-20130528/54781_1 /TAXON_ID=122233 /ORGANISM="Chaetoceros debilis, Strain MM31A-1" /LENGTH=112 /DNA_ID=CAMNT_0038816763 /DNA_START=52 /DNA_END=390 /DNA_ORIENTATION=-
MPSILGSTRQRTAVKQSGKKSQGLTRSRAAGNGRQRHPLKIIEERPEQPKFGQMLLCLAIILAGFVWNIKQGKAEFLEEMINRIIELFGRYLGDENLNVSVAKDSIEVEGDL